MKIKGYWYKPGLKTNKMPGVLTIDEKNNIELKIFSDRCFDGNAILNNFSFQEVSLLLGESSDQEMFTLYYHSNKPALIIPEQIIEGHFTYTFKPNFVFQGIHFNDVKEIKFVNYSANFKHLSSFLGIGYTVIKGSSISKKELIFNNQAISFEIDLGRVNLMTTIDEMHEKSGNIIFQPRGEIKFNFWNPVDITEIFRLLDSFSRFLILSTSFDSGIFREYSEDSNGIEVISKFHSTKTDERIYPSQMNFSVFKFGPKRVSEILSNWFEFDKENYYWIILFIESIRESWNASNDTLRTVNGFLNSYSNLCQSIEGFFANLPKIDLDASRNSYIVQKQKVVNNLRPTKTLSKDDIEFIKCNLKRWDRTPKQDLHKKIETAVLMVKGILSKYIDESEVCEFSKISANIRHDFVHLNEKELDQLIIERGGYDFLKKLSLVMYTIILNKIGFEANEAKLIIDDSRHRLFS